MQNKKKRLFVLIVTLLLFAASLTILPFVSNQLDVASTATMLLAFNGGSSSESTKSTPPPLVRGCNGLTLVSKQSNIPSFAGSPAVLAYGCNRNGLPAFYTTFSRNTNTRPVTPIFSLPGGWILSVGVARLKGDCTSKDPLIALKSGTAITLHPGTPYIYCLTTNNASTFAKFFITWI